MATWQVSKTYAGGEYFYQVYRLRDPAAVDHSGNRDVINTFTTEARAERYAKALNDAEENETVLWLREA